MQKQQVKLLDRVRHKICLKHYSIRTEQAYVSWIKRYIHFHNMKHPKDMGEMEIEEFLTDLAARGKVSASTQNQAFNAVLFLYRQVLKIDLFGEINALRAKTPARLPTVLTADETFAVIDAMSGTHQLLGSGHDNILINQQKTSKNACFQGLYPHFRPQNRPDRVLKALEADTHRRIL